jgi:hypothetical protein
VDGEHADGTIDRTSAAAPVEPGPFLWRTLRAQVSGATATHGKEALLYTDSLLTSSRDKLDLGGVTVQVAVGSVTDPAIPAARVVLRWWEYGEFDAPLQPDHTTLVDDAQDYWLGMHVDQEFAAVLSLLLGVRMRSGGTIRRYRPGDLMGRTDLVEHVVPTLPPRSRGGRPMVRLPVGGQAQILVDDVVPGVANLRLVSALHAVTMVRAASVFSDALWVCEHEPELAWLHCVTALELAADRHDRDQVDAVQLLREDQGKKNFEKASAKGPHALTRAAEQHRRRTRAEKKLNTLLTDFPPTAPVNRPAGPVWILLNWGDQADLRRRVETIYKHRSARLHGGVQFPAPLLRSPLVAGAEHAGGANDIEPVWHGGGLGWRNADIPLTLDTFVHLTRSCLLSWWASLS